METKSVIDLLARRYHVSDALGAPRHLLIDQVDAGQAAKRKPLEVYIRSSGRLFVARHETRAPYPAEETIATAAAGQGAYHLEHNPNGRA
jgi:hypothetical protein